MTLISLKPITITFTETCKISVEDYLEWCDEYGNAPSQKGYKKFVMDSFQNDLRGVIDTNNFTFKYGEEKEYEYNEENVYDNETESSFDYANYVMDLSEEEIEEFHKLCDEGKMVLNPLSLCSFISILIMNTIENPSLYYGLKINEDTKKIVHIKKGENPHFVCEYLKDT